MISRLRANLGSNSDFVIKSGLLRLVAVACGGVLTWISFKLSYQFGETMSREGAIACGAISVLSSCMVAIWLGAAETLRDLGAARFMRVFTAVAVSLICWDGFTNSMTSAFQRQTDIDTATITKAKAADVGKSLSELEATEKRLISRQASLDGEMQSLVEMKVGEYSISVRPSSSAELDGQIVAKRLEVEQEAARGGCKGKCLARTKELGHLTSLRAKAAEIETNNAEHARVIAALASVRNKKADAQADAVANLSGAQFQSMKAASWAAATSGDFSRNPNRYLVAWIEDVMGSVQGLMIMLGAQAFLGIGLMTRSQVLSMGIGKDTTPSGIHTATPEPRSVSQVSEQSGNRTPEPARAYPTHAEPTVTLARRTQGDINRDKLRAMLDNMPSRLEARAA